MPTIRPIAALRDTAKIAELCAKQDEPVFITKNGDEHLVVMSSRVYDRQVRKLELYRKLLVAGEQLASGAPLTDIDAVFGALLKDDK